MKWRRSIRGVIHTIRFSTVRYYINIHVLTYQFLFALLTILLNYKTSFAVWEPEGTLNMGALETFISIYVKTRIASLHLLCSYSYSNGNQSSRCMTSKITTGSLPAELMNNSSWVTGEGKSTKTYYLSRFRWLNNVYN